MTHRATTPADQHGHLTQPTQDARPASHGATRCPDCADGLGKPRPARPGSVRARIHDRPALQLPFRIAVFVAGLFFVLLGIALTALPGPLTIPESPSRDPGGDVAART